MCTKEEMSGIIYAGLLLAQTRWGDELCADSKFDMQQEIDKWLYKSRGLATRNLKPIDKMQPGDLGIGMMQPGDLGMDSWP